MKNLNLILTFSFLLDWKDEKIQEAIRQIDEIREAISENEEIDERIKDALMTDLENMKKTLSYEKKSTESFFMV